MGQTLQMRLISSEVSYGSPANDLSAYGSLLVRRAVLRDDWISDTILDLAAEGRTEWTSKDWDTLLAELKTSTLTVADWLILYT